MMKMRHNASSIAPLLSIILSIITLTSSIFCHDTDVVVEVASDNLPEPFSNDKLPNLSQNTSVCIEFLGCIERLPDLLAPQEAYNMKTEFKILTKEHEQLVSYQPRLNCLQNSDQCHTYPYNLSSLIASKYNPNLRTILLIPGYMSGSFEDWLLEIHHIWSKIEPINCIMVSWSGGNRGLYQYAAANTKIISRQITVLLYYLAQMNGLELSDESFSERIYMIGHSLGAHISGFVGQDFGGKVGRITGLDAAGPKFANFKPNYRLDSGDAQLVDAIHTNGGNLNVGQSFFGIEMPIGHLDYYANDGRHQPGCKFDSLGCSHQASGHLFISFLKHELYMREKFQLLNREYHDYHRIFAYKSNDYESFHNGSSLSENCPITTLNDNDLSSEDIRQCLVPVDFITWSDKLKTELEQDYKIDFNSEGQKSNKFYFYTSSQVPYLNHHNLIRIRVTKSPNLDNYKTLIEGCDIMLDIKMANGMGSKHKVKRYNLLDEGDHYEIIVPYLSPNTFSKYSLATLDANDFYVNQKENLLNISAKIFPTSIIINGLVVGSQRPTKGLFGTLMKFFDLARDESTERDIIHHCSLNIESVAVQPMKKLHRKIVAKYSIAAQDKKELDLMYLFSNEDSSSIEVPIFHEGEEIADIMASEIFIDTLVIGPEEDRPDVKIDGDNVDMEPQEVKKSEQNDEKTNTETSSISGAVWLTLTISTLAVILLAVSVVLYKILSSRNDLIEDKSALIV